jgi:hypothetical protein
VFPAPSKSFSDGTETVNEARRGGRGGMGGNVIRVAVGDNGEDRLIIDREFISKQTVQ